MIIIHPPKFFLLLWMTMTTSEQGTVAHNYQMSGKISLLGEHQVFVHEKCYLSLRALKFGYSVISAWTPTPSPTLIPSRKLVSHSQKREVVSSSLELLLLVQGVLRWWNEVAPSFVIRVNLKCRCTCCYRSTTYRIAMHSIESQVSSAADKDGKRGLEF